VRTKAIWCDECKISVYDCDHLSGRNAAPEVPNDVPSDPSKRGLVFLAFGADIPGSSTMSVYANPQLNVKPRRLVVDPLIAPYFRILDIKIGRNSQFANASGGGVGAGIFPPTPEKYQPIANLDGFPIVVAGVSMVISVYNRGNATMEFNALVWCDYALEKPHYLTADEMLSTAGRPR
jgi:hypothetical protein